MKFYQSGRYIFRKMVQMRSYFATTCTTIGTRGAKLPADVTFSGRSMVEMLGVLAIIGVLSVGAISGYSKAMMKYKLNKQSEQISSLLSALLPYGQSLGRASVGSTVNLVPILNKLNIIPTEMLEDNNTTIRDAMGTKLEIQSVQERLSDGGTVEYYETYFIFNNSSYDFESCRNIWLTIKEFSANLWHASMYKIQSGTSGSNSYQGDATCAIYKNENCIKNLDISDIYNICQTCSQTDYCRLSAAWTDNVPRW